jgi:hypothetical protein
MVFNHDLISAMLQPTHRWKWCGKPYSPPTAGAMWARPNREGGIFWVFFFGGFSILCRFSQVSSGFLRFCCWFSVFVVRSLNFCFEHFFCFEQFLSLNNFQV